jgi:hypothetical protein
LKRGRDVNSPLGAGGRRPPAVLFLLRWIEFGVRLEDNFPNDPAGLCLIRVMHRFAMMPPDNWDGSFAIAAADADAEA